MLTCPRCGSKSIPIVYGLVLLSDESHQRGEVALGGCCIVEGLDPDRRCTGCGYSFWADDLTRPPLPPEESLLGM